MGNCGTVIDKDGNEISDAEVYRSSFEFHQVIGRGGFGKVWKVTKKSNKKIYAMKELSKVKLFEKNFIHSVFSERKFLSYLRHPFIINMHYAFQDKDNLYIVMDYKSGGDLRYYLANKVDFNEEQTKFFFACIILGLEYLHFNKIIHRDIKPENLVFDEKGYLCLTDLGIARLDIQDNKLESCGTPGYMAPEIITNQPHDFSCDYYSLGIMLYELVFKRRPYSGRSRREIKQQILSKEIYLTYDDMPNGWSKECADMINRLLRRKSESRIGKSGINEIKSHIWLYYTKWDMIYRKEIDPPFKIYEGDNYNEKFCNKEDTFDKRTYDVILNKVNRENNFSSFYFNFYDQKKEKYFEQDGNYYVFLNPHEESPNLDIYSKLGEKDKKKTNNK